MRGRRCGRQLYAHRPACGAPTRQTLRGGLSRARRNRNEVNRPSPDRFGYEVTSGTLITTKGLAETRPAIEEVLPSLPPFDVPVWLVTHRELHTSRRIRLVYDTIAEYVGGLALG